MKTRESVNKKIRTGRDGLTGQESGVCLAYVYSVASQFNGRITPSFFPHLSFFSPFHPLACIQH